MAHIVVHIGLNGGTIETFAYGMQCRGSKWAAAVYGKGLNTALTPKESRASKHISLYLPCCPTTTGQGAQFDAAMSSGWGYLGCPWVLLCNSWKADVR
ncbi:hypothetical protein EYF80_010629 [Liparis tanakae]|uniref:Uncharacterized protein n=1 Tax=Liparis tanakae TaxID=230148 RepID=A0A4Z2IN15_9TELE|nr:hypothetical protein EYF80_010629 [Liparis tanakae]